MTQWILTSSLLIAAVLFIRAVAGDKLSARLRYALWGLVLLRLLIPGSIGESILSVRNWIPTESTPVVQNVQITEPMESVPVGESVTLPTQPAVQGKQIHSVNRETVYNIVWLVGAVLVGAAFLLSNIRFALCLRRSRAYLTIQTVPVYESAAIDTPCLFGFPRAAVYLTPEVLGDKTAQRHVLAHELTHYRHGDHLWSLLRCVAVTLHWYNPLVWAAALLSQKDGELACDEGALRKLGNEERTDYARTLLGLSCVGYKGVLTAATSMTGSESDLKTRIKRIAANPKMTAAAAIIVAAAMLLTGCAVFTDAKAPEIEGVWQMEVSVLGIGVTEENTGYMEYEFYNGTGMRTDYIDGEIRSAESFIYTLNDDTVILEFAEIGPVREYTWAVEDGMLHLNYNGAEFHLTAVEREAVPYMPEEYWAPVSVVADYPNNSLVSDLTDTQQAQMMELLRRGYSGEKRKEVMDNDPYMIKITTAQHGLTIANGLVYVQGPNGGEEGYVLTNMAEIEAWLRTLAWVGERFNPNMETDGFVPADMVGIVDARMIVYGKAFQAVDAQLGFDANSEQLAFLEELLSTAVEVGYPTACPFEGYLEVTLSDGRVLGVVPALDSCAAFMIGDTCYEYGNQFAYDDEGSYDNTELLAVFGLNHDTLMELWETTFEPVQGEVIGTTADIGDVVRVLNDVMQPTRLPDSTRETLIALLAEGLGEAIGEETVDFNELYYTVYCEDLGAAEGCVTLSDNGSLYMDGVRYELRTAEAILQLLDAHYNEMRITAEGRDVVEMNGVVGEFLYVELHGVPMDSTVRWVSENEDVCTVTGDATGAEIYITGSGMASVSVHWSGDNTSKADGVVVYGDMGAYATVISQEDLSAAEELSRKDYEAWRSEDYCISMNVLFADVDEAESVRLRMMYDGFEDGWTKEYLAENFVVVRVQYDCELDHQKTFLEDGIVTKHTILVRKNANSPWEIWDYSY